MISNQQISFLENYVVGKINKIQLIHLLKEEYDFSRFDKLLDETVEATLESKNNNLFRMIFYYLPTRLSLIENDKIYKKYH